MKRAIVFTVATMIVAACPIRPKGEESTDDGARQGTSETGEGEPEKPQT